MNNFESSALSKKVLKYRIVRHANHPNHHDLLLLHGFLGSGRQFDHLIPGLCNVINPVTLDISMACPSVNDSVKQPGHSTGSPDDRSVHTESFHMSTLKTQNLVSALQTVINKYLEPDPILLGYSMGGRLALSWAIQYPDQTAGLILESTTAGIEDPDQRKERRQMDKKRAEHIRNDFPAFLKEWEANALFLKADDETDSGKHVTPPIEKLRNIQANNDPETAASWLIDFGTGTMPSHWKLLHKILVPVLVITGGYDRKFCEVGKNLNRSIPHSQHVIAPGAAHRVHIDKPDWYLSQILSFLENTGIAPAK